MALMRPDPTFYPSPKMAMQGPPERLAYVALINPTQHARPDAIGVVDVDPDSNSYGRLIGQTDMPQTGDELHHFGWNACSSCLCPTRRIRTWSGGIWLCRELTPLAFTFLTLSPTRASPNW